MVPPTVFYPRFTFSTQAALRYLETREIAGKKILELCAGNGIVALRCAQRGAEVLATDIYPLAVASLQENALKNGVKLTGLESDLFENIPLDYKADILLINPPYYPKDPASMQEHAWYCGAGFEFFHSFFAQLAARRDSFTECLMVVTLDSPLDDIRRIAFAYGFSLREDWRRRNFGDISYIFKLYQQVTDAKTPC